MSSIKRSLLLLSIGVVLLAGLMGAFSIKGSRSAFASGCDTVATGDWSNNCLVVEGNISSFVDAIQYTLDLYANTDRCFYNNNPLVVDGNFGPGTFQVVECFQRYKSLQVDGKVGPQTWEALNDTLGGITSSSGGWNYYAGGNFRVWASSGKWYVLLPTTWCQINSGPPC